MPAKLDRCVEKIKAQLIKKGKSPKEAEKSAWAICRKRLKLSKK